MAITTTTPSVANETTTTDLPTLASWINNSHARVTATNRSYLTFARECGDWLKQAKTTVPRGQWLAWIKANLEFTPRMAQYYVTIADEWETISRQCETVSHLTLRQAVKLVTPEKPSRYIPMEEFQSDKHQRLRAFAKRVVVEEFRFQSLYELVQKEEADAKLLAERLAKLRGKESKARNRAEKFRNDLERLIREEFEKREAATT